MNRTTKLLVLAGILALLAVASYMVFMRGQSKDVVIESPVKAEMIRNLRQQMSAPRDAAPPEAPAQQQQ